MDRIELLALAVLGLSIVMSAAVWRIRKIMAAITVGILKFESRDLDSFESLRLKTGMSAAEAIGWMLTNKKSLLTELVRHRKFGLLDFWCLCCDVTAVEIVEESIHQGNSATFDAYIGNVLPEEIQKDLIARAKQKPSLKRSAYLSQCTALSGTKSDTGNRDRNRR